MDPTAKAYADSQITSRIDEARRNLRETLNQRHNGTVRDALAIGNKVLFALQVLNDDTAVTEQTFTVAVHAEPPRE